MSTKPHSEDYFGDWRDYWWNGDFMELMAKRWSLSDKKRVLDVGCGIGHWGHVLAPHCHPDVHLIGVDREADWVKKAGERAEKKGLQDKCHYQIGDATKLDFPDNSFDLVTCQTVLIHLAKPQEVIVEFLRVLKPGGLLAVSEPNNTIAHLVRSSLDFEGPIDDVLDGLRFQMISERGKAALGLGHNSLGDMLPGYFAQTGLADIQVFLSDKPSPLYAPYQSPEQKALIAQSIKWAAEHVWIGGKAESLKYFIAGGGTTEEFAKQWTQMQGEDSARFQKSVEAGTYHSGGGVMMYMVSGTK